MEDRLVWQLYSAKSYTVRCAYQFSTSENDDNLPVDSHKLWIKSVILKVNLFTWSLFLNQIPTKVNLFKGGV